MIIFVIVSFLFYAVYISDVKERNLKKMCGEECEIRGYVMDKISFVGDDVKCICDTSSYQLTLREIEK